ncbi:MAG: FtsX-like permease family protein [Flammeovirgaceae bacterium]|nr:FtsX-like permease family protein [Flammeovirgaceae bacterium]
MNLPFFIARRYLVSKRKKNFINIISILSVIAVAFSTAALVIVLSVFNGLGDLLYSLNSTFDPELKIQASKGKSFIISDSLRQEIKSIEGVAILTEVIEDYAYVRYRDANQVVTIKGVSDNFIDQKRIDNAIVDGELKLKQGSANFALIGQGLKYALSIAVDNPMYTLQVYYIRNVKASLDPSNLYTRKNIVPAGVFSIVQNLDDNYVIVPLSFAEELTNYQNRRTSLEIKIKEGHALADVQVELKNFLGQSFNVLNQQEQHTDLYRLLKMEKLFTFLAFVILLGIGSINIFFCLMMLALDKRKDISVLSAMGADQNLIRKVFLFEGSLIALSGALLGLLLGGILCWLQMNYGLVSMGMASAVSTGYPVKMIPSDFITTVAVVTLITVFISWRPAVLASRFVSVNHL